VARGCARSDAYANAVALDIEVRQDDAPALLVAGMWRYRMLRALAN
jgi:hypothetical protein